MNTYVFDVNALSAGQFVDELMLWNMDNIVDLEVKIKKSEASDVYVDVLLTGSKEDVLKFIKDYYDSGMTEDELGSAHRIED